MDGAPRDDRRRAAAVEIDDAARRLGVSPATVRRDLDELAEQQLLVRTRGGAVAHSVSYDLPLRYKLSRRPDEKRAIAAAAAERGRSRWRRRPQRRHHHHRGGPGAGVTELGADPEAARASPS